MERAVHNHNLRCCNLPLAGMQARQLDGGFVGFGTGITEKRFLHTRQAAQCGGEGFLPGYAVQVGAVHQGGGLSADGCGNFRVRVPQIGYRDTGQAVEILIALIVPQAAAFAAHKMNRQALIHRH